MTQFRFKIENGSVTYTSWYDEVGDAIVTCVQSLRLTYPTAALTIERQAGSGSPIPIVSTGSSPDIEAFAGENLGGHRAVSLNDGLAHYTSLLPSGITLNAASQGGLVIVRGHGEIIEPSWNWGAGPVWLGINGTLTQTAPLTGTDIQMGVATGAHRMLVRIQEAVTLAA